MLEEVVLRQPGESELVCDHVRKRRRGRRARQEGTDRFALVESERRDEDETDDVRRSAPAVMIWPP